MACCNFKNMKTLGIEKRSAILYVRIKPSLLAFVKGQAREYKVQPSKVIEAILEARLAHNKPKKPRKRT